MKKFFLLLCFLVVMAVMLSSHFFILGASDLDRYMENGRFRIGMPGCDKSSQALGNKNCANADITAPDSPNADSTKKVPNVNKKIPPPKIKK